MRREKAELGFTCGYGLFLSVVLAGVRELEKKKEREKKLIEKYEPYIDQQTR